MTPVGFAWSPPLSFVVVPGEQPGLPGARCTGALLRHVHDDHVETERLSPDGMGASLIHAIRLLTDGAAG